MAPYPPASVYASRPPPLTQAYEILRPPPKFLAGYATAPILELWNKEWGHHISGSTVSRDRYKELMKHLRFDNFSTRSQRRQTDKLFMISEIWNAFIENCKKCYVPSCDLTIDEQLFPCKTRCPFIQYMPNKLDKFGIKFWLLADVRSKYLCN